MKTNKKIKQKLFKLLATKKDILEIKDWKFIDTHLTYEIINEYIDRTGRAVLLPHITIESTKTITLPITELLRV